MLDSNFRQKFLTKILNPQMGILTQSQIKFLENQIFKISFETNMFFWRIYFPNLS